MYECTMLQVSSEHKEHIIPLDECCCSSIEKNSDKNDYCGEKQLK